MRGRWDGCSHEVYGCSSFGKLKRGEKREEGREGERRGEEGEEREEGRGGERRERRERRGEEGRGEERRKGRERFYISTMHS